VLTLNWKKSPTISSSGTPSGAFAASNKLPSTRSLRKEVLFLVSCLNDFSVSAFSAYLVFDTRPVEF